MRKTVIGRAVSACAAAWVLVWIPASLHAQDGAQAKTDLARQSQNPLASIYSIPFQNNTSFNVGPNETTNNTLNIQPVIPLGLGKVNLINRLVLPIEWQGEIVEGIGSVSGLGDLTYEAWLSPTKGGKLIWGLGPSFIIPTATDDRLGSGKWSLGPSLVLLTMPGHWVLGTILQNTWSFAGDEDRADVNSFLAQPFANYNLSDGWYLTSGPIITANWEADSGDKWTVPLGGGVGKLLHLGRLPVDTQVQFFYIVVKPEYGADWSLRVQAKTLFPK